MSEGRQPSSRAPKAPVRLGSTLEQGIGCRPVLVDPRHLGADAVDLGLQRVDPLGELVLAQRIEVLPGQEHQRIVRLGREEIVIHAAKR